MELEIVVGLITVLTLLSLRFWLPLRRRALDNQIIADLNQVNMQIQAYYTRYQNYPESLQKLQSAGFISSIPKIKGTDQEISYQRGYLFIANEGTNLSNTNWQASTTAAILSLVPNFFANNVDLINQYFAFVSDTSASNACLPLRQPSTQTKYRLGAPMWQPEGKARNDATPCTDRFYDIIVK